MDSWEYKPQPDLDTSLSESLRDFPRQPSLWMYGLRSVAALAMRGWLRTYHRLEVTGREHLPEGGSFVMICNHTSHLDTLCMLAAMPLNKIHNTFPAAAADYFFSSLPRSAVSSILINALPFDRKVKGAESLTVCSKLLANQGNVLVLFPEGTRTTDGQMGRFRSGIGRLVAGRPFQVVPCYLEGGCRAWPKGKAVPRPRKLKLAIGQAKDYAGLQQDGESVRFICNDLQTRVAALGDTLRDTPR